MNTETRVDQAGAMIRSGRLAEGLAAFHRILEQEPGNVQALAGCGVGECLRGNHEAGIKLLQDARALAPGDPRILSNLGHACMSAGRAGEARGAFEKAYGINDQDPETCYWLGYLTEQEGDEREAERLYKQAIERDPSHRQAHLQLSNVLYIQDRKPEALAVLRNAEARFPGDRDITYARGKLASKAAPGWHLPMLADQARNDAFEAAINARVKPGDIALDIGTGSGLLAMMAARAGADHVYACEADEILAPLAREIVERNGFRDKITILEKHSTALVVGEDLPRKADLLITEIFDSALVGEGALPTIRHAREALLTNDAHVIPEGATLHGALAECPHLQRFHNIGTVKGFDLGPMNALAQPFSHKDAQIYFDASENSRILSAPFIIKEFDFRSAPELAFQAECPASILETGEADSVLIWFDLHLAPGVIFSTRRAKAQHHWRRALQVLLDTAACQAGKTAAVKTRFDGYFDFTVKV